MQSFHLVRDGLCGGNERLSNIIGTVMDLGCVGVTGAYAVKSLRAAWKAGKIAGEVSEVLRAESGAAKGVREMPKFKILQAEKNAEGVNDSFLNLIKSKSAGFGSTGRQLPIDLEEQITMKDLIRSPFASCEGKDLRVVVENISDARWKGWRKWEAVYRLKSGRNITIHFNYNEQLKLFDDFKFKN